jgi:hypothetical protein
MWEDERFSGMINCTGNELNVKKKLALNKALKQIIRSNANVVDLNFIHNGILSGRW